MNNLNSRIFVSVVHLRQLRGSDISKSKQLKQWFENEQSMNRRAILRKLGIELLGAKGKMFTITARIEVDSKVYFVVIANKSQRSALNLRHHIDDIERHGMISVDGGGMDIDYDVSQGG
jgi:hypothetical protein